MRMLVAVLCLVLAVPAHAEEPDKGQLLQEVPAEQLPAPPAKLLVPLTDEQAELPMLPVEPGVAPKAEKAIVDQVPSDE